MPKEYLIRLVARGDDTVEAVNEHGARVVMGSSGPERFSPVELLLAALGGCAGMDFMDLMEKQRSPLHEVALEVTAERAPDREQRLAWARVTYRVALGGDAARKAERARRAIPMSTCTVSRTLVNACPVEHVVEPPAG